MSSKTKTNNSNPTVSAFSTGGGGNAFENSLGTEFLVRLLTGAPISNMGELEEVQFQTKEYKTDDFLLIAKTKENVRARILVQSKHGIKFTSSNEDFSETITRAWQDFSTSKNFNKEQDQIWIATEQIISKHRNYTYLFNLARICGSYADFYKTVDSEGKEKKHALETVKNALVTFQVSEHDLWSFLKCLHAYSYDFDDYNGKDKSNCLTLLSLSSSNKSIQTDNIYSQIFEFASQAKTNGIVIKSDSLPDSLTKLVQSTGIKSSGIPLSIKAITERTDFILNSISTKIVNTELPRTAVLELLKQKFSQDKIIIISGEAGSGKSGLIKNYLNAESKKLDAIVLRTQDLNYPSLQAALTNIGVASLWQDLEAYYSNNENKVILLESLEKLAELKHHDAFIELLERIKRNNWKLVATCRAYQLQRILSLLQGKGLDANILKVPLLTDVEIKEVVTNNPNLTPLYTQKNIKQVLKNPFYLDKAARIDWSSEHPNNLTIKAFRHKLWQIVIEGDVSRSKGNPLKRSQIYKEIIVERARKSFSYIPYTGTDIETLTYLLEDNLLVENIDKKYAPSHDVFEDWALEVFIDDTYQSHQNSHEDFFQTLGKSYIIRRAFNNWCSDKLSEQNIPIQLKYFLINSITSNSLSNFWKESVTANILKSNSSKKFLTETKDKLLADNKLLLKRFIHILRVACKQPDPRFLDQNDSILTRSLIGSIYSVPTGSGWASIIEIIHENISQFNHEDSFYISNLFADWYAQIDISKPLPTEAKYVVEIAAHILADMEKQDDKYIFRDGTPEKLTQIILQLPDAKPEITLELIDKAILNFNGKVSSHREVLSMVSDKLLIHTRLCKYQPDKVIQSFKTFHYQSTEEATPYAFRSRTKEFNFGINYDDQSYFPSSPIQGPFSHLLKFHPQKAIDFILDLSNHCTNSYATHHKLGTEDKIIVEFEGEKIEQWCNLTLWTAYRTISSVSQVYESALQALENWLLTQLENNVDINPYAIHLLKASNSVAITAILASIAIAYPNKAGNWIFSLLSVPEFYRLDFTRANSESKNIADIRELMGIPARGGIEDMHYKMRKHLAAKEHRKHSLEDLCRSLQFTKNKKQIQSILDKFYKQLPKPKRQTHEDKIWRIALHRIDLRKFDFTPEDGNTGRILIQQKSLDEDLAAMSEKGQKDFAEMNRVAGFSLYAQGQYDKKETTVVYSSFTQAFNEAQQLYNKYSILPDEKKWQDYTLRISLGHWIGFCFRDKLQELNKEQIKWCLDLATEFITAYNNNPTQIRFVHRGIDSPAYIISKNLPFLLNSSNIKIKNQARELLTIAITHADSNLRVHTSMGIRLHLWNIDESLPPIYAQGILETNRLYAEYYRSNYQYEENSNEADKLKKKIKQLRNKINKANLPLNISSYKFDRFDLETTDVVGALAILAKRSGSNQYHLLFNKILGELLKKSRRTGNRRDDYRIDYSFTHELSPILAEHYLSSKEYALELAQTLLDAMNQSSGEFVAEVINDFILHEDGHHVGENFDALWLKMSEKLFTFNGLTKHYDNYTVIKKMLFGSIPWKNTTKEWGFIKRNPNFVKLACENVSDNEDCFEAITYLFKTIGQCLLPEGFIWLADGLKKLKGTGRNRNYKKISYALEELIRNSVYTSSSWNQIKENPIIKESIEYIADELVDNGSAAAYMLREIIVAPTLSN